MPSEMPHAELGQWIRSLRGRQSQRELAHVLNCGRSTINRIELGRQLPSADLAELLDSYFGLEGALVERRVTALHERHTPAREAAWTTRWLHNYPAAYAGPIFMHVVVPRPVDGWPVKVTLRVRWGSWELRRTVTISSSSGVLLAHSKGDDGLSLPVVVRADRRAQVSFHLGVPRGAAIDINPGWVHDGT